MTGNTLKIQIFSALLLICLGIQGCQQNAPRSDAYGNFEATATLISSQTNGQLLFLQVEEGNHVPEGELVAIVDTTQLDLQRKQVIASMNTLPKKLRNTLADIEVLKNQKANVIRERDRVERLLSKKAATPKQLDDLNGQIDVIDRQIEAIRSQTEISNRGILAEKEPLLAQLDVINEKIRRAYIYNPVSGTVLTKLAEPFEVLGMGSPLYRIGDLDTMTLRFYADAIQLQSLKLGQRVQVLTDKGEAGYDETEGVITWIAEEAEFTPKTIQTKEDRVNLVYAIKASVPNPSGLIKMGMPAEVNFTKKDLVETESE